MEITACPECGSKHIFQATLGSGLPSGYTSNYVCKDCGYKGMPFIFDNEVEYKKFKAADLNRSNNKDKVK